MPPLRAEHQKRPQVFLRQRLPLGCGSFARGLAQSSLRTWRPLARSSPCTEEEARGPVRKSDVPKATQPSQLLQCRDWGQCGLSGCGGSGPAGPSGAKPVPWRIVRPVVWPECPASRNTALTPHPMTPVTPPWGSWNGLGSRGYVAPPRRKGWARGCGPPVVLVREEATDRPRPPPMALVCPGVLPPCGRCGARTAQASRGWSFGRGTVCSPGLFRYMVPLHRCW